MITIIYNSDGSVKSLTQEGSINQGSSGATIIFASIEGLSVEDYSSKAVFTLPDGTVNEISGWADSQDVDGTEYSGYSITITAAQTAQAGILGMSLYLLSLDQTVLTTYRKEFSVNPTGYIPEETAITEAQYDSLLSTLAGYQLRYVLGNVRAYQSLGDAEEDYANLADGQIFAVADDGYIHWYRYDLAQGIAIEAQQAYADYVTIGGAQTITGIKTFQNQYGTVVIRGGAGYHPGGVTIQTTPTGDNTNYAQTLQAKSGTIALLSDVQGMTVDDEIIQGSTNPVSGGAIYDALIGALGGSY